MPPGKEGKIELAVEHTEGLSGEIAKQASVATNDPKNANMILYLRARFKLPPPVAPPATSHAPAAVSTPAAVKPPSAFLIEPAERWITSVIAGSSTASSLYLVNNQPKPVHVKKLVLTGTDFNATLQPIQDGRRYEVRVATNPDLKPGRYNQTLRVMTDSGTAPETPIDLEVTVYPRVFASPTSIIMPRLAIASDLSSINWPMIYVRKLRDGGLKIKSFTSTLPFLKLDLLTETEGQVYKIRLTLDKTQIKPGEFRGKVWIETNDPDVPVLEVPIQGSFS